MTDADDEKNDEQPSEGDAAEEEGSAGSADPSKTFKDNPPDEDEQKEIEETREERLDPENRPEGSEVDNTGRTFDEDEWEFEDGEGGQGGIVDPAEKAADRGHGSEQSGGDSDDGDQPDTDSGDSKAEADDDQADSDDQADRDEDADQDTDSDKESEDEEQRA